MALMPMMAITLLDTSANPPISPIPELVHEVHELVDLMFSGHGKQIGVVVELATEPPAIQITLKQPPGVLAPAPPGITINHVAFHTMDKPWAFRKDLEATCACGKHLTRTEYMSTLRHTAVDHAAQAQLQLHALAAAGLQANGDAAGANSAVSAQTAAHAACLERCKSWEGFVADMAPDDRMKALAGMIGAGLAGYSDPALYQLGLSEEAAIAFEDISKAMLEDESLFTITSTFRPVRPAEDDSPEWVSETADIPLTAWALCQPWYLQYPASRDHPGVMGADMCLPARRAASRVRSEFSEMEAFDELAYEEQADTTPPKVTLQQVVEKLSALLHRTGDWRTPQQFVHRLGISLPQLADLVNLKEIGGLAIDMCCRCGVFVLDAQPAVACEYCVDAYHLQCQGLKAVPEGEWICPGCTLASGATGKAALEAAARARSKAPGPTKPRDRSRARQGMTSPRAMAASAMAAAQPMLLGSPRSPGAKPGRGPMAGPPQPPPLLPTSPGSLLIPPVPPTGPPQPPPALPMPLLPPSLPPGARPMQLMTTAPSASYPQGGEETESEEDDGTGTGAPKRQRLGSGGFSRRGSGTKLPRNYQYRPNPADAQLYVTYVPGSPMPSADGRTLVVRIATNLLNRQVAPISNRWCAQAVLSMKMLAGINCEYHYTVNTGQTPVLLSEGTLVHGGVRCNRCRRANAGAPQPPPVPASEPDAMQVDVEGEGGVRVKREEADVASLPAFSTCNQVFRRIADFESHLRPSTSSASSHIWLPKHRLYLKGTDGTKGLMDLAKEEAARNPQLSAQLATATEIAQEARRRAIEEGKDPDASDVDDLLNNLPTAPRGSRHRSSAAATAAVAAVAIAAAVVPPEPAAVVPAAVLPVAAPAPSRRQRSSAAATAAAAAIEPALEKLVVERPIKQVMEKPIKQRMTAIKREISPVMPGFDSASVLREAGRVRSSMGLQLSEAKVLAQLPRDAMEVDGVSNHTAGKLMTLVMVRGTGQYALAPKLALDPALAALEGVKTEGEPEANGNGVHAPPTPRIPGIPIIPASLLPQLLEAGGTVLQVEAAGDPIAPVPSSPPHSAGTQAAADGNGGGSRPSSQPPENPDAASAKVASLKLMRRFSALSATCSGDTSASAALKGLRACREAANLIPDAQLQLESMGFIADLVTQLETLVGQPATSHQPTAFSAGEATANGAATAAAAAAAAATTRGPKLTSLVDDVQDLKSQLEEWAGVKKPVATS